MRIASLAPDVEYSIQQSNQALASAVQQVSTGLRVNQPSDDPAASANLATSLAESANVDQYTANITAVTSQLQTADSAISSVVSGLTSAISLGTQGATGTTSNANRQTIASQVEGVLNEVVSAANTSIQGSYVFGGSATTSAPVVAASETYITQSASVQPPLTATLPLTAGSVTTVSDAATGKTFVLTVSAGETISDLTASIANAVSNGTLSAGTTGGIVGGQYQISTNSSSNGLVVHSNDPILGQFAATQGTQVPNAYAYVGNSTANSVRVGDSLTVPTSVAGNQIFTGGANAIGALNGLITALKSGNQAQIGVATQAVSTALNSVDQQRVPISNSISQLNSQESYLSQEKVTLSTQQTTLVGSDLATAAVTLSQAQVQNSAILAVAAKVLPETLLNYISPGVV